LDLKEELSLEEEQAVKELIECCNAHDGTRYTPEADGDAYLLDTENGQLCSAVIIYSLGETRHGRELEELAAFTRPEKRRQGRLRAAMNLLQARRKGPYRFAVYDNPDAAACLEALKAVHENDDLLMVFPLEEAEEAAFPPGTETDEEQGYVRTPSGEAYRKDTGGTLYIAHVLTYPSCRRKGCARALLKALLWQGRERGSRQAMLQVSTANQPALRLYESLGFRETQRVENWYIEV